MANVHEGHRKRVYKEFLENGLGHFPDHKVLETLLFYVIPRADTNEMGHRLIDHFGSISGVFDASYDMLLEVEGIGTHAATLIHFMSALIQRYMNDFTSQITSLNDTGIAKEYFRYKFLCQQTESIIMVCAGQNGRIVYCRTIAQGSPDTVSISAETVLKTALRANASNVYLAHNHPSGIAVPSSQDMATTSLLYKELERMGILLADHIIVAPDGVYSMKEQGMLPRGYAFRTRQ